MKSVIEAWLARVGPSKSTEVAKAVGLSASTVRRWVDQNEERVLKTGRARGSRIALRRRIEGLRTPVVVFEIDRKGVSEPSFTLHPVQPFGFWIEAHSTRVSGGYVCTEPTDPELPWFFQDLGPEGYLGRIWVSAHAGEGFPTKLSAWSGDDTLRFCALHGVDLPGSWVIGAHAKGRLSEARAVLDDADRAHAYPALADQLLSTSWPGGSTPGGEQPKFTARVQDRHCIVKFSPPMTSAVGRRWADLLMVEHLVHQVLEGWDDGTHTRPLRSARSQVLDAGGRRFLEVERFDRLPNGGRCGVVSLASLDAMGVGRSTMSWSQAAAPLRETHRLPAHDIQRVVWLECFGHLIANSDMHPGNLSFLRAGTRVATVAPVYDMLPMHFAPRHGELRNQLYLPTQYREVFPASACAAAREVWDRVLASPRISEDFKRLAAKQAALVPLLS